MAKTEDDIDLDQVVWDPRYRRKVIERLNRKTARAPAQPATQEPAELRHGETVG